MEFSTFKPSKIAPQASELLHWIRENNSQKVERPEGQFIRGKLDYGFERIKLTLVVPKEKTSEFIRIISGKRNPIRHSVTSRQEHDILEFVAPSTPIEMPKKPTSEDVYAIIKARATRDFILGFRHYSITDAKKFSDVPPIVKEKIIRTPRVKKPKREEIVWAPKEKIQKKPDEQSVLTRALGDYGDYSRMSYRLRTRRGVFFHMKNGIGQLHVPLGITEGVISALGKRKIVSDESPISPHLKKLTFSLNSKMAADRGLKVILLRYAYRSENKLKG